MCTFYFSFFLLLFFSLFPPKVMLTDNGIPQLSSTTRIVITVDDINDHSPEFDQKFYKVQIPVNAKVDQALFQVSLAIYLLGAAACAVFVQTSAVPSICFIQFFHFALSVSLFLFVRCCFSFYSIFSYPILKLPLSLIVSYFDIIIINNNLDNNDKIAQVIILLWWWFFPFIFFSSFCPQCGTRIECVVHDMCNGESISYWLIS